MFSNLSDKKKDFIFKQIGNEVVHFFSYFLFMYFSLFFIFFNKI